MYVASAALLGTATACGSARVQVNAPPPDSLPASTSAPSSSVGSAPSSIVESAPSAKGLPPTAVSSPPPPQVYVAAVDLIDPTRGAILVKDCPAEGDCAFRVDETSDGGLTWDRGGALLVAGPNGSPSSGDPVTGIAMVSSTEIYAFGASLWRSTDGGATWTPQPNAPPIATVVLDRGSTWLGISCAGPADCSSSIDALTDNQISPLPDQPSSSIREIVRQGQDAYLIAEGDDGAGGLLMSADGGRTWQRRALPQHYCAYSLAQGPLAVTRSGVAFLVCSPGASAGSEPKDLYASDDGGRSWRHVARLETYGYAGTLVAATPTVLWRYGGRAPIFRSTDAGLTWQPELADDLGDNAGPETQAFAAAGMSALAFGFAGEASPAFDGPLTINEYLTTDAGQVWRTIRIQP